MRAGLWVGILCIVWGLLPLQTVVAQGNKKAKVKIVNADSLLVGTLGKPSRFIGNVHMTHENTLMWCDSLYQYELPDSNYLEAFGHVRVIKNDSIRMSGDYMYYDANKKLIQVRRNVTLEDPQMILTTDFLDYDGLFDIGYYFNWGQLKDSQNTLDSKKGNYFTQTKIALFKDSVKVNSPEYLIFSDTLKYNTETKLVSILGPTNIYGKEDENNTLYSEDGWYDSNLGHAELYKNNRVTHQSYEGVADTMVIDSITGMAYLYWNVTLVDTVNNVIDVISMLPYIIPGSVVGIALIMAFNRKPLILTGTMIIMVIALVIRRLPYTIRSSVATLQQIPITVEEAAISLGSSKAKTFFQITVPMMANGIISGAILSWVTIITELSTAICLYTVRTQTLTLAIYTYVSRGNDGIAAALATILSLTTVVSLLLFMKLSKSKDVTL